VAPPTGASLRVLLVEDDPDHVELVKRGLEGQARPVEVEVVGDGEAALRRLEADAPELPDLLLLDLRLPGMEGLRLLQEVRARSWLAGLRCVVLTTSDAERDRVRARELRADDYLVKPGDLGSFARLVREATAAGPAR
jgi:DNA-binding response OmpR family regulator